MKPKEEKPESQKVSQPAGEARGEALTPQGQGGPHLPDIEPPKKSLNLPEQPPVDAAVLEQPAGRSLSEQFESGPDPVELAKGSGAEQPAEEPHKCFVCNGPDHRACGCEAKEMKRQIKQDDESFRSQDLLKEELDREDANAAEVLDKPIKEKINAVVEALAAEISDDSVVQLGIKAGMKYMEMMQAVLDILTDQKLALDMVVSQLDVMIEAERSRANLLKDIQNAGPN